MSNRKILHVITGLGNGGAEAVMTRLIEGDAASGNLHYVVSLMDHGIYARRLQQLGVPVYAFNCTRGKIDIFSLIRLFGIIKKIKPSVVQTWMYHADLIGGIIARLAGIRSISWGIRQANLDPAYNGKNTLRVVRLCARLSSWVPKKIVTCSEEAMRLHKYVGYQAEKFVLIPNGYSMNHFKPDIDGCNAVRAELKISSDVFVVGMVARFDVQKDHRNLLSALNYIKSQGINFICLLIGVGIEQQNEILRSWLEEAGVSDSVRLLGPRNDIPAVMNALDVHVLSSLGEAFPNVLAEAMACGTPCVTTDVGDAAFIVGKHGWVVEPQNAAALANGLLQAYDSFSKDDIGWKSLQSACRLRIMDNFELELMCERYRQVWKSCIET